MEKLRRHFGNDDAGLKFDGYRGKMIGDSWGGL